MRSITVVLHDDESVEVNPSVAYMGEHRAAQLEIILPERLREGFDYYTLAFDQMGAGRRVPLGNIYPGDEGPAYVREGVIYCLLPGRLTHCSYLRAQVEGHKQEDGRCYALEKSAPFTIAFEDSLVGEGETLQAFALGHMSHLMAEIDAARGQLEAKAGALDGDLLDRLLDVKAQVEDAREAAEQLRAEWQESADELAAWLDATLEAALEGMEAQTVTINAANATYGLRPGTRYRFTVGPTTQTLNLILDDSKASPERALEFSFTISLPAVLPQLNLANSSGAPITLPAGFEWAPETFYEVNVVDGLALVTEWEAA